MRDLKPITMVMVDDNVDEIFLTRRKVRSQGIVNHFISERRSEFLIDTLVDLMKDDDVENLLILMDINMPRMDGFEALKLIRKHAQFKQIPVIMFSASDDEADMSKAARLGANGYMVKPFAMDTLIGALSGLPNMRYHLVQ